MNDFRVPPPRSPYAGHPWDDPSSREEERLFRLWADAVRALQQRGADFDARKAEQAAWAGIRDYIADLWGAYDAAIERAEATEQHNEELRREESLARLWAEREHARVALLVSELEDAVGECARLRSLLAATGGLGVPASEKGPNGPCQPRRHEAQ